MKKINKPIIKKILLRKKTRKKEHNYKLMQCIFFASILLLIISFSFNIFQFILIKSDKISSNLGTKISFEINDLNTQNKSIIIPSSIIGNQELSEEVFVENKTNTNIYFRFRIDISYSENNEIINENLNCNANDNYIIKNNYYYYNNHINSNEKINIFNKIISKNISSNCDYYTATITIEMFDNITTAKTIWNTPDNWLV